MSKQNQTKGQSVSLSLIILPLIIAGAIFVYKQQPTPNPVNLNATHNLVTKQGELLDSTGKLIEFGYAKKPVKQLNEENLRPFLGLKALSRLRYKGWDFFATTNEEAQVLIILANIGYASSVQIQVFLHKTKEQLLFNEDIYNPLKQITLPSTSNVFQGEISYSSQQVSISVKYEPGKVVNKIHVRFNSTLFEGDFTMSKVVDNDEIVMITPFSEDHRNFFYDTKTYCMEVDGKVEFKNSKLAPLIFSPLNTQGGRDIGRGVWNYLTQWFWAHAKGYITGTNGVKQSFGMNLGNGIELPNSNTYEDSIFIDGKMHKLHPVVTNIYPEDLSKQWTFITEKQDVPGSLNALFSPMYKSSKHENKFVIDIKFEQIYGVFSGFFIDNKGNKVNFSQIYGFCEHHRAKW
ncbi:hypothetical protein ABPG74_003345 [Tetrahymena malaccensis]